VIARHRVGVGRDRLSLAEHLRVAQRPGSDTVFFPIGRKRGERDTARLRPFFTDSVGTTRCTVDDERDRVRSVELVEAFARQRPFSNSLPPRTKRRILKFRYP
jgi:hypothetical protein